MDLTEAAREFDHGHEGERAILAELDSEGMVLFSRDIEWGNITERQLVAVVAGADGPDLVCASAWPASFGGGMLARIDVRCPVEAACRRFLSGDGEPRARKLGHTDSGVAAAFDPRTTSIWSSSTASGKIQSIYLLRVPTGSGPSLVVATDVVDRGSSTVRKEGAVLAAKLLEWAGETFGPVAAAPR